MQRMLDKLDELRSIFVLGQRAVPFIEEVVLLIKDMSPLLDSINGSLQDSASKLPSASSQLESVSQATEMATTEILNLVDLALMKCNELGKKMSSMGTHVSNVRDQHNQFQQVVEQKLGASWKDLAEEFATYSSNQESTLSAIEKGLGIQMEAVNVLKEGMTQIMLSLQVQDITSQQIASVNHLIQTTRERLHKLTENLGPRVSEEDDFDTRLQSGATFDSNARYDLPGLREVTEPESSEFDSAGDFATMGDIDKLFANQ
ncbi:MAG: protein phosphatase CheZ [Rhodothermales bacterium]